MQNEEMTRFFDLLAPSWSGEPQDAPRRAALVGAMGILPQSRIADIGSGRGVLLPHLLALDPAEIVAIDLSSKMISLARAEHLDPRITFIVGDALEILPFGLDAAVLFNAYPHFMDKKTLAEALSSRLVPGGLVCIAHSKCRAEINARHSGAAFPLSVPLLPPMEEAKAFAPWFDAEKANDGDTYLLCLRKKG